VVGVTILIINERLNVLETLFESIAFLIGASGMILAMLSEIGSYQDEKRLKRLLSEIQSLNRQHDEDEKVDAEFQKKLDYLISLQNKGGKKRHGAAVKPTR
jgi:ABC-type methionine transport system ATPase subunit